MQTDDIAVLITEHYAPDVNGVTKKQADSRKQVFCKVQSVSRSEFFDAGQLGLQPEIQLVVSTVDYHSERLVEWQGNRYAVYRTYPKDTDTMELYLQRETGVQNEMHDTRGY